MPNSLTSTDLPDLTDPPDAQQAAQFDALELSCQKLQEQIAEAESKLASMASPAFRHHAQNRVRQLQAQLKNRRQRQRSLGLALRSGLIRGHLGELTLQKQKLPAGLFFEYLCTDSLKPLRQALIEPPYGGKAWSPALRAMTQCLEQFQHIRQQKQGAEALKQCLRNLKQIPFPDRANPNEKALFKRYLLLFEYAVSKMSLTPPRKQAHVGLRTERGALKAEAVTAYREAERDPAAFELSLDEGIHCLQAAFEESPPEPEGLQRAIQLLTRALHIKQDRFEPYFSLAYIFAQLQDWKRALALLERAESYSDREDIRLFKAEVVSRSQGA